MSFSSNNLLEACQQCSADISQNGIATQILFASRMNPKAKLPDTPGWKRMASRYSKRTPPDHVVTLQRFPSDQDYQPQFSRALPLK
jgi:hypothetical protein